MARDRGFASSTRWPGRKRSTGSAERPRLSGFGAWRVTPSRDPGSPESCRCPGCWQLGRAHLEPHEKRRIVAIRLDPQPGAARLDVNGIRPVNSDGLFVNPGSQVDNPAAIDGSRPVGWNGSGGPRSHGGSPLAARAVRGDHMARPRVAGSSHGIAGGTSCSPIDPCPVSPRSRRSQLSPWPAVRPAPRRPLRRPPRPRRRRPLRPRRPWPLRQHRLRPRPAART